MISKDPLRALESRLGVSRSQPSLMIPGILTAIIPPCLLILIGFVLQILASPRGLEPPKLLQLGPFLTIPVDRWFGEQSELRLVVGLVSAGLVLTLFYSLLLAFFYRSAYRFAIDVAIACYKQAAAKNEELAVSRGVSGQNAMIAQWYQSHVPSIRSALFAWCKSWPRLLLQAILFLTIGAMMNLWVALMAVISLALLGQVFVWASNRHKRQAPSLQKKILQQEQQLGQVSQNIALLSTVRSKESAHDLLSDEIRNFHTISASLASLHSWKTPLLIFITALLVAFFSVVMGVQLIDRKQEFSLAAAITLGLAIAGATISLIRLLRQKSSVPVARKSAAEILDFLNSPVPVALKSPTAKKDGLSLNNRLLLNHVTLQDSKGERLLQDISLELKPKEVVAIVSSRAVEGKALAELLLGFGRPLSGRMLFDEELVSDIDPEDFPKKCIWVSTNGPLLHGTIEDNLRGGLTHCDMAELTDAVRAMNAYEATQQFENGLSTLVTAEDDRLQPDLRFRLGLARALLRSPALVVAEEPELPVTAPIEVATTAAVRNLADTGTLVVVLPKRLTTLRSADQVVLVHNHSILDIGTHSELLMRCELYRHLNYLRFSPLREIGPEQ